MQPTAKTVGECYAVVPLAYECACMCVNMHACVCFGDDDTKRKVSSMCFLPAVHVLGKCAYIEIKKIKGKSIPQGLGT